MDVDLGVVAAAGVANEDDANEQHYDFQYQDTSFVAGIGDTFYDFLDHELWHANQSLQDYYKNDDYGVSYHCCCPLVVAQVDGFVPIV